MSTYFAALLAQHHKPELAKREGLVYQVWHDGEITLQKCGPLLWCRSLHSIEPPLLAGHIDPALFPERYSVPGSDLRPGYIFTDAEGAKAVRQAMVDA